MRDAEFKIDFDEKWYLHRYSDVAAAIARGDVSSALDHYLKHGKIEGRLPRRPSKSRDKIVHLHIPKTAGTSIHGAFLRAGKRVTTASPTFTYDEKRHGAAEVITGHIGYTRAKECSGEMITILRDPVDRFLSYYFYLVNSYDNGSEISLRSRLAKKYSIGEFVFIDDCPDLITDIYNSMTWQLIHESDINERAKFRIDHGGSDSDLLQTARKNLLEFTVVGFQEQMGTAVEQLKRAFGIELALERENPTLRRLGRDEIDIRTITRILDWVYLDMEVYKWALNFLSERSFGPRLEGTL